MKKLVFLFAAIASIFTAEAQQPTKEQIRQVLAADMADFTAAVQPAYKKGQTYAQFEAALLGKARSSQQGKALIKKAFGYLSTATPEAKIKSGDSGLEMGNAAAAYESIKTQNPRSDGSELFGGTTGGTNPFPTQEWGDYNPKPCKWWQLDCHLANFFSFVNAYGQGVVWLLGIFGVNIPQPPVY